MPHEVEEAHGGYINRSILDFVKVIYAAHYLHISRHGIAENSGPIFIAHGGITLTGPGTMTDDSGTPNESQQITELRRHPVKITGAQTRANAVVMPVQRIKGVTQLKQFRHLLKWRRVVVEII